MKKIILINLICLFSLSVQAQETITKTNVPKHELGGNFNLTATKGIPIRSSFGISYAFFIGEKTALQLDVSKYQGARMFLESYHANLGIMFYLKAKKGLYTGVNLGHSLSKESGFDNMKPVVNENLTSIELGYTFLIKDKFVIQPYFQPIEYNFTTKSVTHALNNALGLKAKVRF